VVVDESGQPVAGVKMKLQGQGNRRGQFDNVAFHTVPLNTDPQGRWRITYIPKDMAEIRFELSRKGYATTQVTIPETQNDFRNLTLVIDQGRTVTGRITDADGQPIAGARVAEFAEYGQPQQSTKTDQAGAFALTGLAPRYESFVQRANETNAYGAVRFRGMTSTEAAKTDLIFEAKGFASQRRDVPLSEATNQFNLTLLPSLKFRGRVVDETGDPIPGAAVRTDADFDRKSGADSGFKWLAHTDAQGRFEWDQAPREEICYWFEAAGFTIIRGMPLAADGRDHEIKLTRDSKTKSRPSNLR
jgi:protocatechuate 3,4-dioxygenase beta subunit